MQRQWVVLETDRRLWHSQGIAGRTVFRFRQHAERYAREVRRRQQPGQRVTVLRDS